MNHHLKFLSLGLLVSLSACQFLPWGKKEAKTIFVGEPETIIVEPPEDAFDISYRWSIQDLPDESAMVPDYSSYSNIFTFTPDVVGDYIFAVIVVSYGEDVSDHEFQFEALEDTSVVPRAPPMAEEPVAGAMPAVAMEDAAPSEPAPRTVSPPAERPAKPKAAAAPSITRAKAPDKNYRSNIVAGHFTIQVSSWKTARQAQKVMQQVASETGYDAYIQRVLIEDRNETWWRVRVGDFMSLEEAKVLQNELSATFPGTWVDNLRKEDFDPQL